MNAISMAVSRDTAVRELLKPLADQLARDGVNEIAINGPGEYWIKTFEGWQRSTDAKLSLPYLDGLAAAICTFNGKGLDTINSVVMPDGERAQIVRAPCALDGFIAFNLRTHTAVVKTLEELDAEGCFSSVRDVSFNRPTSAEAEALLHAHDFTRLEPWEVELLDLKREGRWADFLRLAVLSHCNMVIAGATGSGKTTFARSLIEKVPTHERIVTFEDVHELKLPNHPNKVHLLYGEGAGRVSPEQCLKSAMRMSPDRIFPAEIRGNEAWEYIGSLNTGHPGSITTTHANNCLETFGRIFTLVKSSKVGQGLDSELIRNEIYKTINVVLFFKRRRLVEVFYDPIFTKSKTA